MVTVRPVWLQLERKDRMINPVVLVQVLADSTVAYDRGQKFAAYRTIRSFQEYLLIRQDRCRLEHFVK